MKFPDFKNKKVTIMGLGLLGRGLNDTKFFVKKRAQVTVTDLKSKKDLKKSLDELKGMPIKYTLGKQRYDLVARIEIIDNGPGIDEDMRDKIFFPMVTGRAEGTGLGLSIAQSLIQQHDGLIEVDSVPGCTVFTVLLPI